jgi:hypothetical protein
MDLIAGELNRQSDPTIRSLTQDLVRVSGNKADSVCGNDGIQNNVFGLRVRRDETR